jgi:hypothetical protein
MAVFKSVSQARRSMRGTRNRIKEILDEDLGAFDEKERSYQLWLSHFDKQPEYLEKKDELEILVSDMMDAETHILYAKSTSLQKKMLTS